MLGEGALNALRRLLQASSLSVILVRGLEIMGISGGTDVQGLSDIQRLIDSKFKAIADGLRAGQEVRSITVRDLLGMFGYSRRRYWVVNLVRSYLGRHTLKTVPDFDDVYLDSLIHFELDESQSSASSASVTLEPTKVVQTPDAQSGAALPSSTIVDSALRLSRLAAANKPLIVVRPDASLSQAVTLMLNHDYSQLPVMTNDRDVKGVVSWNSIGTRLCNGAHLSFVREAMDPPIEAPDRESLFAAIPIVVKYDYLLVRAPDRRITGIVTSADLGMQFQQLAEPFLLLGEIENYIRRVIATANFTSAELAVAVDPSDTGRVVKAADDMTFGEYIRLLQNENHWQKTGLKLDRITFCSYLEEVRRIRNDVMHFDPDGIEEGDLEVIRRLAQMVQRLVTIDCNK